VYLQPLRKQLKGINFICDEEVQPAVGKWFQELPDKFKKRVQHWQHSALAAFSTDSVL
jgi:hypothetical protein